jgi:acyl-CoA hydrolase
MWLYKIDSSPWSNIYKTRNIFLSNRREAYRSKKITAEETAALVNNGDRLRLKDKKHLGLDSKMIGDAALYLVKEGAMDCSKNEVRDI